ncbi:MAG: hypothetical protein RIS36_1852 [Pseudomonadota bacterium]
MRKRLGAAGGCPVHRKYSDIDVNDVVFGYACLGEARVEGVDTLGYLVFRDRWRNRDVGVGKVPSADRGSRSARDVEEESSISALNADAVGWIKLLFDNKVKAFAPTGAIPSVLVRCLYGTEPGAERVHDTASCHRPSIGGMNGEVVPLSFYPLYG